MSGNSQKETEAIVEEQIDLGTRIYEMSSKKLFISAFTAGLEISFSLMLMALLYSSFGKQLSPSSMTIVMSLGYPIGFIFVILGRSELFTEQTALAMIPVLNKGRKIVNLLKVWIVVLLGNLFGGLLFSLFISWFGPAKGFISAEAFTKIAEEFINYSFNITFFSAVLAGWMMGLLGWLLASVQESVSRILLVILVTIIIGFAHLHHCVVGSVEVLSALWINDEIGWMDYFSFLGPSVLGNLLGGAFFVAVLKFVVAVKD